MASGKSSLKDAAYLLAKNAYGAATHAEAKTKLQADFPGVEWEEVLDAYLAGCHLAEGSYDVAETARDKNISDDEALRILKERFPGFGDMIYKDALSYGWFLSR